MALGLTIIGLVLLFPDGLAGGRRRAMTLLSVQQPDTRRSAATRLSVDVSFEVAAGEVVALIGPNGAGKTTCFNMLNGQIRPDAGEILLDGIEHHGLASGPNLAPGRRARLSDRGDVRLHDRARQCSYRADLPPRCGVAVLPTRFGAV